MNLTCVITARPSWPRVQTALEALRARGHAVRVVTAASAQIGRYGAVDGEIRAAWPGDGVWSQVEGDAGAVMARTTALSCLDLASLFDRHRPDAVITVADRHETLGTAIAAAYQGIPLIHVQGGEVTGSIDDKVRDSVSMLADFHAVATMGAKARLCYMGVAHQGISRTGCPSVDLAARVLASPGPVPSLPGVGPDVDPAGAVVVLWHPVTTEQDGAAQTKQVLEAVLSDGRPVIWFHPNVDTGADAISKVLRVAHEGGAPIRFVRHVPAETFLRLLTVCGVLVGNSSVGIREASFMGVPVVNVGTRQQGRERGPNVIDVRPDLSHILMALLAWRTNDRPASSDLYGDGQSGVRFATEVERWLT